MNIPHRLLACRGLGLGLILWWAAAAWAGIPAAYNPVVLAPTGTPARWEFDLNPAVQQAQRSGKRLYVYMGAHDCSYCKRYEAFLDRSATELVPHFARDYLVVDLRSSLAARADKLFLRLGDVTLPYVEFQRSIGDERTRQLVYPTVWVLDARGKPLMQMPAGAGTFETVPEQLEILRLEN